MATALQSAQILHRRLIARIKKGRPAGRPIYLSAVNQASIAIRSFFMAFFSS